MFQLHKHLNQLLAKTLPRSHLRGQGIPTPLKIRPPMQDRGCPRPLYPKQNVKVIRQAKPQYLG
ncbi:hypothetical protein EVAR_74027_1, partial [Eumeta japonica]